jgi:hypothetical protein
LSQDGLFTGLLQWADNENSQQEKQLNESAKDFVRVLLGKTAGYSIEKFEAGR